MKGKTNLLKAITLALVCAIIVNLPVVRATTATVSTEKIDKELLEIIDSAKSNDTIPVAIWFNEIDSQKIENDVKSAVKMNKASFEESFSSSSERKATSERYTHADVDKYIETERELYSKAQTESHNAFIEKHDWLQTNKRGTNEEKIKFVSKYAPMMIAELTVNEILSLSKNTDIQSIAYLPNQEFVNASNIANSVTKADVVRDTIGYTGSGIKIGMIELEMPDPNSLYLSEKGIVYDPSVSRVYSDHATLVASIMIGNIIRMESPEGDELSFEGVAPDAKLYATRIVDDDVYSGIEWLLSKGVNIINMSAGADRSTATYTQLERWIDHIAINHSVHFVIAAGNVSDEYDLNTSPTIYEPALACNVITVGNVDDNNTLGQSDDALNYSSCYIEHSGNNKPDLVAPGTDIRYGAITYIRVEIAPGIVQNSPCTGTSFAAPQVTGIVAQLCERQPSLKTNQAAMKAILTASINHSEHTYTTAEEDENKYDKYGAGMVNAKEALTTVNYSRYASSSFPAYNPPASTHSYTFNVASLDTIRVSLSWLQYSSLPSDHMTPEQHVNYETMILGDLSDLCLKVYDPNGNQVAYSDVSGSNTEIVQFEPSTEGNYTIKITNGNVSDQIVYYGLAWAILEE